MNQDELWKKAVSLMPRGTQTMSKCPDQFVDGVYPKFASQPITEEQLLKGELEETNEAYAVICSSRGCSAPIHDPNLLRSALTKIG